MGIEDEFKNESKSLINELNLIKELLKEYNNNRIINNRIEEEIRFTEGLVEKIVNYKKQLNNKLNNKEEEEIEDKINNLLLFFFDEFPNRQDKLKIEIEEFIESEKIKIN